MGSLNAGHIVAGRYRLVSPLGRGAMGEVWKAIHTGLGTPVAIKVIVDADFGVQNPKRAELVARFFREAQAAASLRSPHVVQIFDHGDDGVPYIAMELLEGETLEQRLESERVLSPKQTAEIITQISRAVGKAHEAGIVHRDLKPGNVFLVKNDDQEIAKVLDFGIAKVSAPADGQPREGVMTRTGSVVGTPCYMSPEQALGNKSIDFRADLWSMAIIAFECLVGRRPFDGDALGVLIVQICAKPMPIPSKMASVPIGFDAWFAKAASREPAGRFSSAKAMADALRELLVADNLRMTPSPPNGAATTTNGAGGSGVSTGQQRTHAGVVSAIVDPGKRRPARSALFAGALVLSALVIAGIFVAVRGSASPVSVVKPASTAGHTAPTAASTASIVEALPATAIVTPSSSVTSAPTGDPDPTLAPSAKPLSAHSAAAKPPAAKPPVSKPDRLGF
jgi:eukaryotic-like serine/threonine-protein kinase